MTRARVEVALSDSGEIIASESGTYSDEELPLVIERVWSHALVALERRDLLRAPAARLPTSHRVGVRLDLGCWISPPGVTP